MPHARTDPVIVIGAGFAGLTAARELADHGVPFEIHEASDSIAGLARSFKDADGFTTDFGAHLVTNRLAKAIGAESICRRVEKFGESVRIDGRALKYPFGLLRVPRFLKGALRAKLQGIGRPTPKDCAEALRREMGDSLANEVAIPVMEALNGVPAETLAASAAHRLPHPLWVFFLRAVGRLTRRVPAVGYTLDLPETPFVWHVYPEGGIESFCRILSRGIDDRIKLRSPIEHIVVKDERVRGVMLGGEFRPACAVISTMPVDRLAAAVRGSVQLSPLADFRYGAMIFVNLRFHGRGLLPNVVLWEPSRRSIFYRLTEPPAGVPHLAPPGKTFITADITAKAGDGRFLLSDADLIERTLNDLAAILPGARAAFIGGQTLRTRIAYPILDRAGEEFRRRFARSTGIEGLVSLGRNGEFAHILMEDVHHRARRKTRALIDEISRRRL